MSKSQTLRALVNERLAAAAEEIFVLVERTIAEYEEELCRSKEENQRKQELLDKVLYPRIVLVRGNVQIPKSPGSELNLEITETPWIKEDPEEQSFKQEEEQLPEPVPESSAVCVKTEEPSRLQQRQTEHREETQGEDISSETHFSEGHAEHWSDAENDDWESYCCAAAQMETEADGDYDSQVQIRDESTELSPQSKSAPETTVHTGHTSADKDEGTKHQCHVCNKRYGTKQQLHAHIKAHIKPYSCSICLKAFAQKEGLRVHIRTHTGERPYRCEVCEKTFTRKTNLDIHKSLHTGDKPYSCTVCNRGFRLKPKLRVHERTHTGEKPYCCPVCKKHFATHTALKRHQGTHTRGETLQLFNL